MLKIYTDYSFLSEKYRRQLFPLLFDVFFLKSKKILDYYQLVKDINECDIVVFPIDYSQFEKHRQAHEQLKDEAVKFCKPIWIYTGGDYGYTLKETNVYVFRFGGFKSKLPVNTFILPAFISDPYAKLKLPFKTITKTEQPMLGFVGHANFGIIKFLNELALHYKIKVLNYLNKRKVDSQLFYPSSIKRYRYLKELESFKAITTHFIYRSKYRSGVKTKLEKEKTTQEFYENMYNNPYVVCLRGVGNFSVRFFETLAVGRIPILINTDCKLPLENIIDWTKHCLIINNNTRGRALGQQILDYHNSMSLTDFNDIQHRNRLLWQDSLERQSYFIRVYSVFKTKLV